MQHSFKNAEEWRRYTSSIYEEINEMMKMLEEYNEEMLAAYKSPFERMAVYLSEKSRADRKYLTEYWLEAKAHYNMAHRKDENA
jgi:hypothetical protein